MGFKPTDEQEAIIAAFATGDDVLITAYAGSGKTATCRLLAQEDNSSKIALIAYNKSIATDAAATFPRNTICKTSHGFAFGPVGKYYADRLFKGHKSYGGQVAGILSIRGGLEVGDDLVLSSGSLGRMTMEGVRNFCYSDDQEIAWNHVPFVPGADMSIVRQFLLPYIQRAWQDVIRTDKQGDGKIGIRNFHDIYLKLWALGNPRINADVVMLDEAQDSNPCVSGVLMRQKHAQKVMVGDQNQQIYAWRGAVDAMESFPAKHRMSLTQSFRFGPAVADEANKWLTLLGNDIPLRGFEPVGSRLETLTDADAMLCRTNAGVVAAALESQTRGKRVAVVGGTEDIKRFAKAADDLQHSRSTDHPDLAAFKNWAQVRTFVEEEAGDLKVMVNVIDTYGTDKVIEFCETTVDEKYADAIFSTAHKSKGREWDSVKIGTDFQPPEPKEDGTQAEPGRSEMMLAYVSVTRAMKILDRDGLAWVDDFLPRPDRAPDETPATTKE